MQSLKQKRYFKKNTKHTKLLSVFLVKNEYVRIQCSYKKKHLREIISSYYGGITFSSSFYFIVVYLCKKNIENNVQHCTNLVPKTFSMIQWKKNKEGFLEDVTLSRTLCTIKVIFICSEQEDCIESFLEFKQCMEKSTLFGNLQSMWSKTLLSFFSNIFMTRFTFSLLFFH